MIIPTAKRVIVLALFQISVNASFQKDIIINDKATDLVTNQVNKTEKIETEQFEEEKLNENKTAEKENKNKENQIANLEKEKGELFKQINAAIEESIQLLNKANETEAQRGITFMKELKEQIKEINGTDMEAPAMERIQRRNYKHTGDGRKYKRKIRLSLAEIANLFQKKDALSPKDDNHAVVQARIDQWIKQRESEREQKYQAGQKGRKLDKLENCKRHGFGKKTIKVGDEVRKRLYPCCRKCCKKSYMGCL